MLEVEFFVPDGTLIGVKLLREKNIQIRINKIVTLSTVNIFVCANSYFLSYKKYKFMQMKL